MVTCRDVICLFWHEASVLCAMQALDVTAEPDGVPPQRVEFRPDGRRNALAAAWPAIAGISLAALLAAVAGLNYWRRRSRRLQRAYEAVVERCWRPCNPSGRRPSWTAQVCSLRKHYPTCFMRSFYPVQLPRVAMLSGCCLVFALKKPPKFAKSYVQCIG